MEKERQAYLHEALSLSVSSFLLVPVPETYSAPLQMDERTRADFLQMFEKNENKSTKRGNNEINTQNLNEGSQKSKR